MTQLAEGKAVLARKTDKIFKQLTKAVENASIKAMNEQQRYQQSIVSKEAMGRYIAFVLKSGGQPLPILNRIGGDKALYLMNYGLNHQNVVSLCQSFNFVIPSNLLKLYLVGNTIDDECLAKVFQSISDNPNGGLQKITIMKNGLSEVMLLTLANVYLKSEASRWLKHFTLKQPSPTPSHPLQLTSLF